MATKKDDDLDIWNQVIIIARKQNILKVRKGSHDCHFLAQKCQILKGEYELIKRCKQTFQKISYGKSQEERE